MRRAIPRSSSTSEAGGCQATNGMRAANSRRAAAAVRSVFDRCSSALAKCFTARGLATITAMPGARCSARATSKL